MGSMIHLSVGRLEIDWGKNSGFCNHSPLFQIRDLAQVPYYYVDPESPDPDDKGNYNLITEYKDACLSRSATLLSGSICWATRSPLHGESSSLFQN